MLNCVYKCFGEYAQIILYSGYPNDRNMLVGYDLAAFAPRLAVFALAFSLWELVWKGFGLWRAARNGHRWWFVSILVLNTLGILPILYYFFFSGRQAARKARKKRYL